MEKIIFYLIKLSRFNENFSCCLVLLNLCWWRSDCGMMNSGWLEEINLNSLVKYFETSWTIFLPTSNLSTALLQIRKSALNSMHLSKQFMSQHYYHNNLKMCYFSKWAHKLQVNHVVINNPDKLLFNFLIQAERKNHNFLFFKATCQEF